MQEVEIQRLDQLIIRAEKLRTLLRLWECPELAVAIRAYEGRELV